MRKLTLISAAVLALLLAGCGMKTNAPPPPPPPVASPDGQSPATAPDPPPKAEHPPVEKPPAEKPPAEEPPVGGRPSAEPRPPQVVDRQPRQVPQPVRGIHVSGWYAGSAHLLGPMMDWANRVGINTLVLDIKAEDGKLSWISDIPLAAEIGANERKIADLPALIALMHERGFWVVGRIVVMNDRSLYTARPQWAIPGFSGGAYSFMDPYAEGVWRYNLDVAHAAVRAGVDEIQWDYIRFPEKLVDGHNRDTDAAYRTAAINGFLRKSVEELRPLGVKISADVFGLTTSVAEGDDMKIGQDYRMVAEIVDYVSAMAYPSHYAPWTYGIENPDASPYETVLGSMSRALERTPGIPPEKHRPWLQDFTYPAAGAHPYGPSEVLGQVRALQELGIDSFMLWDPTNRYSRTVDFLQAP